MRKKHSFAYATTKGLEKNCPVEMDVNAEVRNNINLYAKKTTSQQKCFALVLRQISVKH